MIKSKIQKELDERNNSFYKILAWFSVHLSFAETILER